MKYASKGLALGVGIPALTLAGLNTLKDGGLGNLFGGTSTSENSKLQAENAQLKAEKYTDSAVLGLFQAQETAFKERDTLITATLIEEGKQQERINCMNEKVTRLQGIVEEHSKELCDNRTEIAVMNERTTAGFKTLNDRIKYQGDRFADALALEEERRHCEDEKIITYVKSNYVAGRLSINPDDICPRVELACPTVQDVRVVTGSTVSTTK